jgi:3-phosphoglycerate kinase
MRTLDDLDPAGKRVFVRVDFNVPLDERQRITDDARIRGALPTLEELRSRGARQLILAAHLGRPKDREPELSLKPAAERLSELLGVDVALAPNLDELPDVEVLMLENVRYEPGRARTILSWPSATRRSPTSMSTTPSAPRTAPTPRPRRWRTCSRRPRAGCWSARWGR